MDPHLFEYPENPGGRLVWTFHPPSSLQPCLLRLDATCHPGSKRPRRRSDKRREKAARKAARRAAR